MNKIWKTWLTIFITFSLIIIIVISIDKSMKQLYSNLENWTKTVEIKLPDCVLPNSKSSLKKMIVKMKENHNWTMIGENDVKKMKWLDGVIAYRTFNTIKDMGLSGSDGITDSEDHKNDYKLRRYQVALIYLNKKKDLLLDRVFVHTDVLCNAGVISLAIQNDLKSCPGSVLFLHNDLIGLIIREDGFDLKRKFTITALATVTDEIKKCLMFN